MRRVGEPAFGIEAFDCPHCGAYASQSWTTHHLTYKPDNTREQMSDAVCRACKRYTLWYQERMVYPAARVVGPRPAADMSGDVRKVYEEARAVAGASPRAAAALLRVCAEMVVDGLEPGSGTLNTKIGKLVERGLNHRVQKMLDSVRFYGNDGGAHPGEIDMNEQVETVDMLMFCINQIVEQVVTFERRVDQLYETLPENKRKGIDDRDRKAREVS